MAWDLDKPWNEMNAEEREFVRQRRLYDSGGEECDECGREGYWHEFTEHEGKLYCSDCAEELGIEEDETKNELG